MYTELIDALDTKVVKSIFAKEHKGRNYLTVVSDEDNIPAIEAWSSKNGFSVIYEDQGTEAYFTEMGFSKVF